MVEGGYGMESALHSWFQHLRFGTTEWFWPAAELTRHVGWAPLLDDDVGDGDPTLIGQESETVFLGRIWSEIQQLETRQKAGTMSSDNAVITLHELFDRSAETRGMTVIQLVQKLIDRFLPPDPHNGAPFPSGDFEVEEPPPPVDHEQFLKRMEFPGKCFGAKKPRKI